MLNRDVFGVAEPPEDSGERVITIARLVNSNGVYSVPDHTIGSIRPSSGELLEVDWLNPPGGKEEVLRAHLEYLGSLTIKLDAPF